MSYSKPPPTSSSDADPSTSTSSLLSAEQRDLVYGQAYSQAVAESDLLEEDDEGELNVVTQTEEAATSEMPDEVFVVEPADLQSFAQPQEQGPDHLDSSSSSAPSTSKFPILQDPRRAVEAAINERFPDDQAAELRTALSRIRSREGWPTPIQLEQFTVRIQAWQDVLLAELEAEGNFPDFARLFTQPAERYLAPVLSQYAWPPLYALEKDGQYVNSFAFGEGGTLTESIVRRMGELENESIIGNVDTSYIGFPGSCTGEHPLSRYLSNRARSALDHFHQRIYRELLRYPRIVMMNGVDVETDLLLPLVAANTFDSETVTIHTQFFNLATTFEVAFIRLPGSNRRDSSILIRRRHPQSLAGRSRPTLLDQMRADIASELLRALAHGGDQLPDNRAFLALLSLSRSTAVTPGDTNEPLEPARTPWSHRLAHLARLERGMETQLSIEAIRFIDFELAQIVASVIHNLPPPTTIPILCPEHIAGSSLQQAQQRLMARSSETRSQTYSLIRKVKWNVPLTPEEQRLLEDARIRKQKADEEAAAHPKKTQRQNRARHQIKLDRTVEEAARALAQDQASYRRRREEMSAQEREGRLEEQSLRSNVRNLDVVSPLDFLSFLGPPPPAPVNADSSLLGPIASGSNALLPVVGSSSNTFQASAFQLPLSNFSSVASNSQSLSGKSRPKPPPVPPRKPGSSKQRGKTSKSKKSVDEVEKEEEEEEEEEPAPSGKGKGVKRKKDDDASMRKRGW